MKASELRGAPEPELEFSLNILKSHSSSLLLHPLPAIDQGHVGFQLFSGYLGSTMHVGRPHPHFLFALQNLLEAELGSALVCPSVE